MLYVHTPNLLAVPLDLSDVTLTEALDKLETVRDLFTDRALQGKFSLWLGSAISRKRVPDLGCLLRILLRKYYDAATDLHDPSDPARQALDDTIQLTSVSVESVDYSCPPDDWDEIEKIIKELWNQYSTVLEVEYAPNGQKQDLAWDVLEVHKLYGDSNTLPDAEHRLLAILVEEGIIRELMTTNWDPLIENAYEQTSSGYERTLKVVVRPDELMDHSAGQPRLIKIHGCAKKALDDESKYRKFIVATDTDIVRWCEEETHRPIREELISTTRKHAVLYLVGLQGYNVGYRCFNLIRASFVSNCQSIRCSPALRSAAHAPTSRSTHP